MSNTNENISNWNPKGPGNHFIQLESLEGAPVCTYRVRADRIDWMAREESLKYTNVGVNSTVLKVVETPGTILSYIEDPTLPWLPQQEWETDNHFDLIKKYGADAEGGEIGGGTKKWCEINHLPFTLKSR